MGNLHALDWGILIFCIVALRYVSLSTRSFMKGVADFLSANRAAGRYLLTISQQMGGVGVVTFVGFFEVVNSAGFTPGWWSLVTGPMLMVIIPLTGWVFYRFRETRAMTMAQFFEARYSRRLRIYAGTVCWTSGVLNFGVFPAAAAHFFVYYCGLPPYFHPIPGLDFQLSTFATVMFLDMGLALSFVTMGGQISVMITECVQGIFCAAMFALVAAVIVIQMQWSEIVEVLAAAPAGKSMLNPFNTTDNSQFGIWYYLIAVFSTFYNYQSWQGTQGFFSSARTPHEQKMGNIISSWRLIPQALLMSLLPIAGMIIMKAPQYTAIAEAVNQAVQHIPNDPNGIIQGQMKVPVALALVLPIGIKGILAAIMLFLSFTCHDTYMHSWGSIFVQDVVMPIRNKPLDPERHIRWLRWSIVFVAVFGFLFSLLVPPNRAIFMFFAMTGTIWLSGSGAVIIGGLYWRKGTAAGAYCALTVGLVFGFVGLITPYTNLSQDFKDLFTNAQYVWAVGMALAVILYVVVSLLTCKKPYELERLLHRGQYAVASDHVQVEHPEVSFAGRLFGITKEFSRSDRALAVVLVLWNLAWLSFFFIFTGINLTTGVSDAGWGKFWHFYILLQLSISVPVCIWFAVGGTMDIRALLKSLKEAVRDARDDGTVSHGEAGAGKNP